MRSVQSLRSISSSVALIAALALSAPALAADGDVPVPTAAAAAEASDSGLDTIVVTGQKRSENLQSTPISISVLKGDDLTNRHVQSLLDLGDGAIPSLKVATFFSRGSALVMNIRGIGVLSDSNQPARDQGVGIYIDGVYNLFNEQHVFYKSFSPLQGLQGFCNDARTFGFEVGLKM